MDDLIGDAQLEELYALAASTLAASAAKSGLKGKAAIALCWAEVCEELGKDDELAQAIETILDIWDMP